MNERLNKQYIVNKSACRVVLIQKQYIIIIHMVLIAHITTLYLANTLLSYAETRRCSYTKQQHSSSAHIHISDLALSYPKAMHLLDQTKTLLLLKPNTLRCTTHDPHSDRTLLLFRTRLLIKTTTLHCIE